MCCACRAWGVVTSAGVGVGQLLQAIDQHGPGLADDLVHLWGRMRIKDADDLRLRVGQQCLHVVAPRKTPASHHDQSFHGLASSSSCGNEAASSVRRKRSNKRDQTRSAACLW